MKTKEFIKEVEKLGFKVNVKNIKGIWIENSNGSNVAYVCRYKMYEFDTAFLAFENIPESHKVSLFNLLICYTRTPLNEREEEKKFYLKQNLKDKWLERNAFYYLNLNIDKNIYLIDSYANTDTFKTQFTQAEIDKIKEKFNTNLEDFEQVPVEDYEER